MNNFNEKRRSRIVEGAYKICLQVPAAGNIEFKVIYLGHLSFNNFIYIKQDVNSIVVIRP